MADKKVYLITGATGFIGSLLTRRLADNGEETHIIVREESKFWRAAAIPGNVSRHISDLSDEKQLAGIIAKVKPHIIYHLAAYGAYPHQNEPDKIARTNILGTLNLLRASRHLDYELFVNTGSSSEYGFKSAPMKETDILEPASYYAVAKASQTLLCSHFAREEKKPIITLRPFSVYGPFEEPARLIPALMKALYFKESMNLVSPDTSHDHIYIDDMIDAYLLTDRLKDFPGGVFNIGTGRQSSIRDVVETAVRITGKTADFRWNMMEARGWDTADWVADISKARQLLHWSPKIPLEKGLALTWEWFKANHSFYDCRQSIFH